MAANSVIDERTRIALMISDALWLKGIVIDGFADKLAHDIVKAVNTGSLERIATSMEKIAERGAPPVTVKDDSGVIPMGPLRFGSRPCPTCGGLHSPTVLCPMTYRMT